MAGFGMQSLPAPTELPAGYRQYELQIAGHKPTDAGKASLGVVEDSATRLLLKPLQSKGSCFDFTFDINCLK